ncbi:MAG: isoprenyl transferase [Candidatus Acetothermia bacterium]
MDLQSRVQELKQSTIPEHVAIIPDGNGRWGTSRGMSRTEGHEKGAEVSEQLIEFVSANLPVEVLTFYTFSTENWARPDPEVKFLMNLLKRFLQAKESKLNDQNIKFSFIGDLEPIPPKTAQMVQKVTKSTAGNDGLHLVMALNYGGRQEILHCTRSLIEEAEKGALRKEDLTEETFSSHLYTAAIPDPDLLIRTSGEIRISNFLLWQLAYAEFWTTETLWPDFTPEKLLDALKDYQGRDRRFGTV